MRIPSPRTLHDMEIAAELRAQGATWQIIARKLKRQLALVHRWSKFYQQEWERLYCEAQDRRTRQAADERRQVLRALLGSKKMTVRLTAADKLARLRLEEQETEPPHSRNGEAAAFLAVADEMSETEFEDALLQFIREAWPELFCDACRATWRASAGDGSQDSKEPDG
ncbi:MAG TPA: hypothetical protein VKS79_21900 [Gemmataceae bacterium]|nr:hypothetical protein [Gemmataceae bacterium]